MLAFNANWNPNTDWEELGFFLLAWRKCCSSFAVFFRFRCASLLAQWHNYACVGSTFNSDMVFAPPHAHCRENPLCFPELSSSYALTWRRGGKWCETQLNVDNEKPMENWQFYCNLFLRNCIGEFYTNCAWNDGAIYNLDLRFFSLKKSSRTGGCYFYFE